MAPASKARKRKGKSSNNDTGTAALRHIGTKRRGRKKHGKKKAANRNERRRDEGKGERSAEAAKQA
jgi:hypothetical protein